MILQTFDLLGISCKPKGNPMFNSLLIRPFTLNGRLFLGGFKLPLDCHEALDVGQGNPIHRNFQSDKGSIYLPIDP